MSLQENEDNPSQGILSQFGVCLVEPLGGRFNRHWCVEAGQERLVLRRWHAAVEDVKYELRLLNRIAELGWPVASAVGETIEGKGHLWSLFPFLTGEVGPAHGSPEEQRARGRLLAKFHNDLTRLQDFGQRGTWRRCEEILADTTLDKILSDNERERPEEVTILRWHLNRARNQINGLSLRERPGIIVHGDFTPWNLRFQDGRLSGILDFELAHWDHRIGEFALAWRGKYDAVIQGYNEVAPLEPDEWELLTPLWWASLIQQGCRDMASGVQDDGWTLRKLLIRSPLMGPDAEEYR